jgi:NADPH:quinone reductase-like Zn-dependent oxidoreductase
LRAVLLRRHGGLDALGVERLPDPTPGPGEALVRVGAVAVNRLDCWGRRSGGVLGLSRIPG